MKIELQKYLFLDFLFAYFVLCGYGLHIGFFSEEPEQICMTDDINNYLKFDWRNYFHWFWNSSGYACRFNNISIIMHNWLLITYYALLKFYGIRQNLKVLNFRVVIPELIGYLIIYLIEMKLRTDILWTTGSFLNATVGFILLHQWFILFIFSLASGNLIFLKTKILSLWNKHKKIYAVILLTLSSAMVFPIFPTLFLCFIAAPAGFAYLYYILPQILGAIIYNKKFKISRSQKTFITLTGITFFTLESTLLLYVILNNVIFNHLWGIYFLTTILHIIYFGITLPIILPKKAKNTRIF